MGGIFKKKDEMLTEPEVAARLVTVTEPKIPTEWPGVNITVVPGAGGMRVLITNLQNDDQQLEVSPEIAQVVARLVGMRQAANWRAAQIRLTRNHANEMEVDVHFEAAGGPA
jgi:hypothetical protein